VLQSPPANAIGEGDGDATSGYIDVDGGTVNVGVESVGLSNRPADSALRELTAASEPSENDGVSNLATKGGISKLDEQTGPGLAGRPSIISGRSNLRSLDYFVNIKGGNIPMAAALLV